MATEKHLESAPDQSIKPGGRPITCPQQSGPARSTPPGLYLFINSHLLSCNQEANAALTRPPRPHPHFPSHRPSISYSPAHFVLLFQSLAWRCPCPLCTRQWDCWGGRMGAGPQRGTGLLILFPCWTESKRQSLFLEIYWAEPGVM